MKSQRPSFAADKSNRRLMPIQAGEVNSFLTESFDRLGLVCPVNPVHPVRCSSLASFSPALLHWSFIFAFIRVHSRLIFCSRVHSRPILTSHPQVTT